MYKQILKATIYCLAALMAVPLAQAADTAPTGLEIMTRVDDRPDGDDRKSVLTMTLINKRGRQRIRAVDSFSKDFGKDGLLKIYNALNFKQQDGFWTLFKSEMNNVSRNHKTVMTMDSVKYNTGIKDNLFRVSTIHRGSIR
ncbi:hypothetical protein DSCO28_31250 [Desulfosarcina ovata subsp. sediminis]|uniref:Uncharacterized protein TP-0789 domain-containing protein n=1 Tax=Desulfosarcina ovata subsp. sediminis TaxID=885957 RepID=A0A5K7ZQG9_9BACT|nr:outer membrane lipoprotein-sorting protein [Desulfosarcina ovata]BBO82559.1 hypothetical protein DSCO28_31250 [Desulfosarcina ovata subsp. sediminis]